MNCIDSIEGTAKYVIDRLHQVYSENLQDDSEYIRNIKTVLEATAAFIRDNPEITTNPELLTGVLYDYAMNLWLQNVQEDPEENSPPPDTSEGEAQTEYWHYYFKYLFEHGNYPQ